MAKIKFKGTKDITNILNKYEEANEEAGSVNKSEVQQKNSEEQNISFAMTVLVMCQEVYHVACSFCIPID